MTLLTCKTVFVDTHSPAATVFESCPTPPLLWHSAVHLKLSPEFHFHFLWTGSLEHVALARLELAG